MSTPYAQLEILKEKLLEDEWLVYVAIAKEIRPDVACYSGEAMLTLKNLNCSGIALSHVSRICFA